MPGLRFTGRPLPGCHCALPQGPSGGVAGVPRRPGGHEGQFAIWRDWTGASATGHYRRIAPTGGSAGSRFRPGN